MELREFHNGLRILASIDRWELEEAGAIPTRGPIINRARKWAAFREAPYEFFVKCDDPTRAAIWSVIEGRM